MSSSIHDRPSLSKLGAMVLARYRPSRRAMRQNLLQAFITWRQRRAAAVELYAMSDRNLADIGLTRQDIPAVLRRSTKARGLEPGPSSG